MFIVWLVVLSLFSYGDCALPDGSSVEDGQSAHLFKYEFAPKGKECLGLTRNCEDDTLDGDPSYIHAFCSQEKQCENPFDIIKMNPGDTIEAYLSPQPPCVKEIRVCDGKTGQLSGTYTFNACSKNLN